MNHKLWDLPHTPFTPAGLLWAALWVDCMWRGWCIDHRQSFDGRVLQNTDNLCSRVNGLGPAHKGHSFISCSQTGKASTFFSLLLTRCQWNTVFGYCKCIHVPLTHWLYFFVFLNLSYALLVAQNLHFFGIPWHYLYIPNLQYKHSLVPLLWVHVHALSETTLPQNKCFWGKMIWSWLAHPAFVSLNQGIDFQGRE